jgi:hypothetical protein
MKNRNLILKRLLELNEMEKRRITNKMDYDDALMIANQKKKGFY